jgi:hypothetical protein
MPVWMIWSYAVLATLATLWYFLNYKGVETLLKHERELNKLMRGENWYRPVKFENNGREYIARVRRWDVPESNLDVAELWCTEGSNPDGWTQFFLWDKDDLKFLD